MEIYTNMRISFNNAEEAKETETIIKDYVLNHIPMIRGESRDSFVNDIHTIEELVVVEDTRVLWACDFKGIMDNIAFLLKTLEISFDLHSWQVSCNCGYEAEVDAHLYKNGSFRLSYKERQ